MEKIENTLETSGEDGKYTRNEWSDERHFSAVDDAFFVATKIIQRAISSQDVNSVNYTRNEWRRLKTTPETSGEDSKLHSKRVC